MGQQMKIVEVIDILSKNQINQNICFFKTIINSNIA